MTQAKNGEAGQHVVRIGMNLDEERAPWLERLDDRMLKMVSPTAPEEKWKMLAAGKKTRLQELLHRELTFSGIINNDMSYAAMPLAVIGIES